MTEDEMVGWHHQLHGHEFEQTLGDGEGQGSLVSAGRWGRKESDTTDQQQVKDFLGPSDCSKNISKTVCVFIICVFIFPVKSFATDSQHQP